MTDELLPIPGHAAPGASPLTLAALKGEAAEYLRAISRRPIPPLYAVTDGKAVGTFVEAGFTAHLLTRYTFQSGNAASGIDFPALEVDLKVTSIRQPQSSCPFRDARQKVYGLEYHLLLFVYEKTDDHVRREASLSFLHAVFIDRAVTGDYQTTRGILELLAREANEDDIVAFLEERNLPLDEIGRTRLAGDILRDPPRQGYVTLSNALQWRLQYGRVVDLAASADPPDGLEKLL